MNKKVTFQWAQRQYLAFLIKQRTVDTRSRYGSIICTAWGYTHTVFVDSGRKKPFQPKLLILASIKLPLLNALFVKARLIVSNSIHFAMSILVTGKGNLVDKLALCLDQMKIQLRTGKYMQDFWKLLIPIFKNLLTLHISLKNALFSRKWVRAWIFALVRSDRIGG